MSTGLDTSVVLRLLLGQPEDQSLRAVAYLDELARKEQHAVVSDLVVAEVYFALQHHYGVTKKNALLGLRRLFASGEILSIGVASKVLESDHLASAKPGFVDRLIHGQYSVASANMATFEKSGGKLIGTQVL